MDSDLKKLFKSSDETKILEYKKNLEKEKEATASKLKTSVIKNYPRFIDASNEIANMESNLLRLRNFLSETRNVVKGMKDIDIKAGSWKSHDIGPVMPDRQQRRAILEEAQWAFDSLYDLDAAIAERRFDEAMELVDTIRKNMEEVQNPTVLSSVSAGMTARVSLLADSICENLNDTMISTEERNQFVVHLAGLGQIERGRDIFFESRSKWIKQRVRSIKLQGDVCEYARELSRLVITAILTTCDDFIATFTDNHLMSSFIVWATRELELFAKYFSRQVFHTTSYKVVSECLDFAYESLTRLEKKGLGLDVVVKCYFLGHLNQLTEEYFSRIEEAALQKIETDRWKGRDISVGDNDDDDISRVVKLTNSAKHLYEVSHRAALDVSLILVSDMYGSVDSSLAHLFETFSSRLSQAAYDGSLSDAQNLSIIANIFYISEDLLPKVSRHLQKKFDRPMHDTEKCRRRIVRIYDEMRASYATQRAQSIVMDHLQWNTTTYGLLAQVESLLESPQTDRPDLGLKMVPSKPFIRLIEYLFKLRQAVFSLVGDLAVAPMMSLVSEEIFARLDDEAFWSRNEAMSRSALHQFILDIRFLLVALDMYCTEEVVQFAEVVVEKAVVQYCGLHAADPREALLSDDWFDLMASNQLESMSISLRDPLS